MHILRVIFITPLLFALLVKSFNRDEVCDRNKFDNCVSKVLILGNTALKFSETRDDVNNYCRELPKNAYCMRDYTKRCLDTFPRQASSLLVYSIHRYFKSSCAAKEDYYYYSLGKYYFNGKYQKQRGMRVKKYLLPHCVNVVKDKLDQCSAKLVEAFTLISNLERNKNKIPLTCCHYWLFVDCLVDAIDNESKKIKICTRVHASEFFSLNRSLSDSLVNYICGSYSHKSDKCKILVSRNHLINSTLKYKLSKTPLPPLIDIFQSL